MSYDLRQDYMDIRAFHCSQVAKSILWRVIGCRYMGIYLCVFALAFLRWYGLSIKLPPILFFVCPLDASWGCWTGKCCCSCCLLCMLELWLLHYSKDHFIIRKNNICYFVIVVTFFFKRLYHPNACSPHELYIHPEIL